MIINHYFLMHYNLSFHVPKTFAQNCNYLNNEIIIPYLLIKLQTPLLFDLFEKYNSTELFVSKPRIINLCPNQAAVEVSDMRLAEIKRERRDFEQFVAKTRQTTPVVAQRAQQVIRYIERKIKAKVS